MSGPYDAGRGGTHIDDVVGRRGHDRRDARHRRPAPHDGVPAVPGHPAQHPAARVARHRVGAGVPRPHRTGRARPFRRAPSRGRRDGRHAQPGRSHPRGPVVAQGRRREDGALRGLPQGGPPRRRRPRRRHDRAAAHRATGRTGRHGVRRCSDRRSAADVEPLTGVASRLAESTTANQLQQFGVDPPSARLYADVIVGAEQLGRDHRQRAASRRHLRPCRSRGGSARLASGPDRVASPPGQRRAVRQLPARQHREPATRPRRADGVPAVEDVVRQDSRETGAEANLPD